MRHIFGKILLTAVLLLTAMICQAQSLGVFVVDKDGPFTNVRNNYKRGAVVDHIPTNCSAMLEIERPVNGWWRIVGDNYTGLVGEYGDFADVGLHGSTTGYWIHWSVIAVSTRNYGGEKLFLRKEPSENAAVTYTLTEETLLRPIEIRDDWVKVKTVDGRGTGWIESDWLCGNSVTNCC